MSVGLQRLRDDAATVRQGAIDKGEDATLVDRALGLDGRRRELLAEGDRLKGERNQASKSIGEAVRAGADPNGPDVATLKAASTTAGERIVAIDAELADVETELDDLMLRIPNPADPEVPVGDEDANVTVREWGEQLPRVQPRAGDVGADAEGATWERQPHWDVAARLGILDLERGAKIAGSGFPVYRGLGSTLQRSLISWFLDVHGRENGFTEIWPPAVVNAASARGTGQIPDKEDQMYVVTRDELYLVPDRRGPGHEPPPGRDPRGRRAADPLRGLYAVLPPRGRGRGQGHPGHPPRPSVRQGRDGPVRTTRGIVGRARVDDRPGRGSPPAPRADLPGRADEHP